MRFRIVVGISLVATALTCALPAPLAAQSRAVFREEADLLYPENDRVQFIFSTGGYAHDYAILGRMLRPPEISVPRVTFDWMDVDLTAGGTQTRQMTSPAVLANAWQSPSGHVGYLLANISGESQQFDLSLKAEEVSGPYLVYVVRDGVYEVLFEGDAVPSAVEVTLPPQGLALVAVVPAGSEEADAARSYSSATAEPRSEPPPSSPSRPAPLCGGALLALAAAGFPWRDWGRAVIGTIES
jgi:hypothetical protein